MENSDMTSNIDEKDLKALAQRGLSLLRLTENRWMEREAWRNRDTKLQSNITRESSVEIIESSG